MSLPLKLRNRLVRERHSKSEIRKHEKLWDLLREQNFPLPGPDYSFLIYVGGAITPSKAYPNMDKNRQRLYDVAESLYLLGYMVYCPSVKWFKDPKKRNRKYFRILKMDGRWITDRVDGVVAVAGSKTSFGFRWEHRLTKRLNKPIAYQSLDDKDALMRNYERYVKRAHKTTRDILTKVA